MRSGIRRLLLCILCCSWVMASLVYPDGGRSTAAASAGDQGGQTGAITLSYADAELDGYGIEKRGAVPEDKDRLYDGEGYISFFFDEVASSAEQAGNATFTVDIAAAGLYKLSLGYYIPEGYGGKATAIQINGAGTGELTLDAPGSGTVRAEKMVSKVLLNAGKNTIRITRGWGYYGIEHVRLEAAGDPKDNKDSHQLTAPAKATDSAVPSTLMNPEATSEARALMKYLADQYGRTIISGQQTLEDAEWIRQQTGKYPAIVSSDLMDYSSSRIQNGASSTEIEKMIAWYKRGGIVALCWHWNAPKGIGGNEPGNEWWRGFNTENTTFDVEYALDHPDSEDYQLLIRDIDHIAVQLKRLQDAGVPVLWRPLHEAEGGWFWWGAKGPEPAKRLWKLMLERLTRHHQLNNLIWVWNSGDPEWYPGDEAVDIASIDTYNPAGDYNPVIAKYEGLVSLVDNQKIVGLAENGPIPDPEMLQTYGAHWSFFNTWTGDFIKDGVTNSAEHLKKVYEHEYVITLDELPADLYTSPDFSDLDGHYAKEDIELLADKSVVHGIGGRRFAPDRLITRAEFTVLIGRTLGLGAPTASHLFSDVPESAWYAEPISAAGGAGLITGYPEGTFQPDAPITREQMAVLIARAAASAGQTPTSAKNVLSRFTDSSSISVWAEDSVIESVAAGLVQGLSNDRFAAKEFTDRAQAAVMIKRLSDYINKID